MPLRPIPLEVFYRYCPDPGCSPLPPDSFCYATEDNDFLGAIFFGSQGWEYLVFKRNYGAFLLEAKQSGFREFPEHEMRGKLNELVLSAQIEWRHANARNTYL